MYEYENWSGGKRIKRIKDPFRKISGQPAATVFYYGTYGLDSIVEPGTNGRTTKMSVNSGRQLVTITDPDTTNTRSKRVVRPHFVIDSFGAVHTRQVTTPLISEVIYANDQKDSFAYNFEWPKIRLVASRKAGGSVISYTYASPYFAPYDHWMARPILIATVSGDGIRTEEFYYTPTDLEHARPTSRSTITTVNGTPVWAIESYAYHPTHGQVTSIWNATNQQTTIAYDTIFGNVIQTTTGNSDVTTIR